jgi:hypothetical protein
MTISTTRLTLNAVGDVVGTIDVGTLAHKVALGASITLDDGTGANQANMIWTDTRTLSASATENLDLAASLTNAFGTTLTFTKVKAIIVTAASGNTNAVQVTRPASNGVPIFMAAGDGIAITPGGVFYAAWPDNAGVAVTAGTGDLLTLTNSAGSTSVTYTVAIIGIA